MAKVFIEESSLSAIGGAIREKTGNSALLTPAEMVTEIENISTGLVFDSHGFENDSWELISQISEAGLAPYYYSIGDTKTVTMQNITDTTNYGQNITASTDFIGTAADKVIIVGFNTYTSTSDQTKKNGIVLWKPGFKRILYNTGYYGWAGGNDNNSVRAYLNKTVFYSLPTDLQAVVKQSHIPYKNNYSKKIVYNDYKLFIPTVREIGYKEFDSISTALNDPTNAEYPQVLPFFADYCWRDKVKGTTQTNSMLYFQTAYRNGLRSMYDTSNNGMVGYSICADYPNISPNMFSYFSNYSSTPTTSSSTAFLVELILFCV